LADPPLTITYFIEETRTMMDPEQYRLLTAKEAAQFLRVSLLTLSKIEKQGDIVPFRTPGGHRRYSLDMLNEYLEKSRRTRKQ
jgi:excisionase family DNA binding protein